ncbi:hypothetical protein IEO21_00988 [Rhodonia placenta]|uniref:Translation initiation factor 3 N-terminal domain-containing protein n=1 Tax=Rhodonia placenta TaxID=104341 RepID=A0A8H7U5Z4_9APHY|nr:hypothetical protein IEO21_00988 [Postia placenta]
MASTDPSAGASPIIQFQPPNILTLPGPSVRAACFHQTAYNLKLKVKPEVEVKPEGRPRNHDIPYRLVRLVNPDTSALEPPAPLTEVIARLDNKKEWVELVATKPEPIVKIIKGSDAFNKVKAQQEKKREKRPREEKEIQLTWGISSGDLEHKLSKVREELEAGNRVNLVYAHKKGHAKPTPQEMEARVQETVDLLADMGSEWKPRGGSQTIAVVYLQGHNDPAPLPVRPLKAKRVQKPPKWQRKKDDEVAPENSGAPDALCY